MVSKKVAEKIRYLEAKTRYERILRENKALNEYDGEDFFASVGDAFKDILKNFKLAFMDMSNQLQFNVAKFLYSGKSDAKSIEKMQKAYDSYKKKHDVIYNEWRPLVQKNLDAISSFDPLIGLAIAPGNYLATKGIEASLRAGKNAAEIIFGEPWASIMRKSSDFGGFMGTGDKEEDERRFRDAQNLGLGSLNDQLSQLNTINAKLAKLFLGSKDNEKNENKQHKVALLEQAKFSNMSAEKWIEEVLEYYGIMQDQLIPAAKELISADINLMKNTIEPMKLSIATKQIVDAKSFSEFQAAIKKMAQQKEIPPEKIKEMTDLLDQAEQKVKDLINDPEFKKARQNNKQNAISDKELAFMAAKSAFEMATKQIKEKFNESLEKANPIVQDAVKALPKSKNDPVVQDIISPTGKQRLGELADEFIEVYEEYAGVYDDFKKLRKQ